jgi:MOSC domain-containing protein YiiM
VNVGLPEYAGQRSGQPVHSAFGKRPVAFESIEVTALGLGGDGQADLSVHGGPEKAVYAYPADNWTWWEQEHRFPVRPGTFGENLTVTGADETQIRIGDRFSWGEAMLEVCQPRSPCYKFQWFTGRDDAGALMMLSGRTGWYFRVLAPGTAPVKLGRLVLTESGRGPSVRELHFAASNRELNSEQRAELAKVPALSEAWRKKFRPRP